MRPGQVRGEARGVRNTMNFQIGPAKIVGCLLLDQTPCPMALIVDLSTGCTLVASTGCTLGAAYPPPHTHTRTHVRARMHMVHQDSMTPPVTPPTSLSTGPLPPLQAAPPPPSILHRSLTPYWRRARASSARPRRRRRKKALRGPGGHSPSYGDTTLCVCGGVTYLAMEVPPSECVVPPCMCVGLTQH